MTELNPIGKLIHERKYARRDTDGKVETWDQTCLRVAITIADAYSGDQTNREFEDKVDVFYKMIN